MILDFVARYAEVLMAIIWISIIVSFILGTVAHLANSQVPVTPRRYRIYERDVQDPTLYRGRRG